ncbi:MAG: S-layer homology domain-containing protein, partial [Eubacteriales bacterium]|nr:S-layer homology domain-containing protein [Eubacteriales bacterium]
MFKRKIILIALALILVLGGVPGVFAQEAAAAGSQVEYTDMPAENHWSFSSLNAAVENGLLNGFDLNGAHFIKPGEALTRAQMATIVNRAFGAQAAASLTGVTDVPSNAWYANEMAKAIQMGTFMRDAKMRPNDSITRQEAFVVLARAFKLKDKGIVFTPLNAFSDKAQAASWAQPELSAMTAAGYIEGSGGMLHPRDTITREEFAKVMDNMVKQYIDVAGTYTEVAAEGNIVIRVPGVTLDGVDIDGDLVIGDGVGNGDAILKNITVEGRAVIRGGGENSVKFIGTNTDVKNIVIARGSDGRVRILTEDGAVLAEAEVDGDSDVILEGEFENVTVMSDAVTVTALNATITSMSIPGEDSVVILSGTSTVETASISGTQSELVVQEGASVDTVKISAPSVTVSGEGTVEDVEVQAGGDEASITTPNTVTTVSSDVEGVTAGGEEVPAGGTATNNDTGTDATITEPSTGGGGGGSTTPAMAISIAEVSASGTPVEPTGGVYIIPGTATKDNTAIDV